MPQVFEYFWCGNIYKTAWLIQPGWKREQPCNAVHCFSNVGCLNGVSSDILSWKPSSKEGSSHTVFLTDGETCQQFYGSAVNGSAAVRPYLLEGCPSDTANVCVKKPRRRWWVPLFNLPPANKKWLGFKTMGEREKNKGRGCYWKI